MTPLSVHQLLSWTPPVEKMTVQGLRLVSQANPTKAFWDVWRTEKEQIKAQGYAVNKVGDKFVVLRYQPLGGAQIEAKAAAREESRAVDANVHLPVPTGLSYLPYQRAGIAYALKIFGDL